MSFTVLSLDPDGYHESAIDARRASSEIEAAVRIAHTALSSTAHMGGNDAHGRTFATAYDENAEHVTASLGDLCDALSTTAMRLDASGASHATAEAATAADAAGSSGSPPPPLSPAAVHFAAPASADGGTNIFPEGWTFIQGLVAGTWPDGDTARMRAASSAWSELGDEIDLVRERRILRLLDPMEGFRAPEIPAIEEVAATLAEAASQLADACRDVARLCESYADCVDETHAQAGDELAQFVLTSATAIGISALLTPFTAGISDLVGGGAVMADAVATAARISTTLSTLMTRTATAVTTFRRYVDLSAPAISRIGFPAAKAGTIFFAKSAYVGAVWGASSAIPDVYINRGDAQIGRDFGTAALGGLIGRGFDVAGDALASRAREGMTSLAKRSPAGLDAVTTGPRHAYSPQVMAASNGITSLAKITGSAAGSAADHYVFDSGAPDSEGTLKDAVEGVLSPPIEARDSPRHVVDATSEELTAGRAPLSGTLPGEP